VYLQVCEKALADYMESKCRAFPRFYFVSTADLLDILSNGNSPAKVRDWALQTLSGLKILHMQEGLPCIAVSCCTV
jgi:hypothetical protein